MQEILLHLDDALSLLEETEEHIQIARSAVAGGSTIDDSRVILNVPFSSQLEIDATQFRNDCGPACLEMVGEWYKPEMNGVVGTDDIMHWITGGSDKYTGFSDLIRAGEHFYGLGFYYYSNVTWAQLVKWIIVENLPVIALVHYGSLYFRAPTSFVGPHFVVATGWERAVWGSSPVERLFYHDPLFPTFYGYNVPATRDTWIKAWGDSAKDGNRPYSCIVPLGRKVG